jgi:hypothetical protein
VRLVHQSVCTLHEDLGSTDFCSGFKVISVANEKGFAAVGKPLFPRKELWQRSGCGASYCFKGGQGRNRTPDPLVRS